MAEINRKKRVAETSAEAKAAIVRNSVQGLGNQPVLSAAEMKKMYVSPIVNNEGKASAIDEVDRVARETNEAIDEVLELAQAIVAEENRLSEEYKKGVQNTLTEQASAVENHAAELEALKMSKQNATDDNLSTASKTVGGAINELVLDGVRRDETAAALSQKNAAIDVEISSMKAKESVIEESVATLKENMASNVQELSAKTSANSEKLLEVESIAKGAAVPLDFDTYADMIRAFNGASATAYPKGNNVHVVTVGVPDAWISGVLDVSVQYVYVTDAQFEADLKKGRVQVGYYQLSELEGQKADFTDYPKKKELADTVAELLKMMPTIQR